jgi:hypothetical protein
MLYFVPLLHTPESHLLLACLLHFPVLDLAFEGAQPGNFRKVTSSPPVATSPLLLTFLSFFLGSKGLIVQMCPFFPMAQQPLLGQGHLIIETSRSHSDTPHSVGVFWTSGSDFYLTTHNTHNRQPSMPPAGFEPAIPGVPLRRLYASGLHFAVLHRLKCSPYEHTAASDTVTVHPWYVTY